MNSSTGFLIEGFEKGNNSGKDIFSNEDFSKILSFTLVSCCVVKVVKYITLKSLN